MRKRKKLEEGFLSFDLICFCFRIRVVDCLLFLFSPELNRRKRVMLSLEKKKWEWQNANRKDHMSSENITENFDAFAPDCLSTWLSNHFVLTARVYEQNDFAEGWSRWSRAFFSTLSHCFESAFRKPYSKPWNECDAAREKECRQRRNE